MRIAALVARVLLGLIFVVFGANGFLQFMPMKLPGGLAGQYFAVMVQSGYMYVVWALQVLCGLVLLSGFYVPLALVVLAPIIVNIFLLHLLMERSGLPMACILILLWILVALYYRRALAGIFEQKPKLTRLDTE